MYSVVDAPVLPETPVVPQEPTVPEKPEFAEGGIAPDEALEITADAHMFKGEKLLLVTVDNISDTPYSIDVTVSYLDPDGGVIKKEVQSFDQLTSDGSKNFVFRPGHDFADYRLEASKTEFKGDCWKSDVEITYYGMNRAFGDYERNAPEFAFYDDYKLIGEFEGNKCSADYRTPTYHCQNDSGMDVIANFVTLVIFDNNGEIYDVRQRGGEVWFGTDSNYNYKGFMGYAFVHKDAEAQAELANVSNTTAFVAYNLILTDDSIF